MDYYQLLGLPRDATSKEIRAAYRRMAEVYHPDKLSRLPEHAQTEGQEIMRLLNEAKAVLLDDGRRNTYDRSIDGKRQAIVIDEMSVIRAPGVQHPGGRSSSGILGKMSRVLSSMKDTFKKDREFQEKIVQAQEMVEARVIEPQGGREEAALVDEYEDLDEGLEGGDEIEMTLQFQVIGKEGRGAGKKGEGGRMFRIIALEGEDEEEAQEAEWEEEMGPDRPTPEGPYSTAEKQNDEEKDITGHFEIPEEKPYPRVVLLDEEDEE